MKYLQCAGPAEGGGGQRKEGFLHNTAACSCVHVPRRSCENAGRRPSFRRFSFFVVAVSRNLSPWNYEVLSAF